MNLTSIYSNLSLQVLKIKEVEIFYDEYFNFELSSNCKLAICVVLQSLKPIHDEDIFLNFIKRNLAKGKEVVIITDNSNYFNLILNDSLPRISLFEFPSSLFLKNDISIKNLFKFQFPFGKILSKTLKNFISDVITSFNLPKIKNICLDFDNTLWEGIIGNENTLDNKFEKSSSAFLLFQNKLKELKKYGILLCLVTKNNKTDIYNFFQKNKSMPLKLDDFIIVKSNWNSKSKNIVEISNELNISTDTFLYFDDSDFELEEVKINLPNIRSHKVSSEILNNLLYLVPEFQEITSRKKSIDKTLEYKNEFKRKKSLSNEIIKSDPYNFDAFKRLEVNLEIKKDNLDLKRISEMSEKTNQFNFNKKILHEYSIIKLLEINNTFFTCSAKDKYGDYGIIGYIHINSLNQIENFVLSCRALSRGIEYKFFEHVINTLGLEKIVINYKKTDRNKPSQIFLEKNNKFELEVISTKSD